MSNQQVTLLAAFKARPGKEAELRKALLAMIPPTHKEDGCIDYDLHVAVDDPAKFLFYENWTSKAHLDKHAASAHLKVLHDRMDELCVEPVKLTFWEKIG